MTPIDAAVAACLAFPSFGAALIAAQGPSSATDWGVLVALVGLVGLTLKWLMKRDDRRQAREDKMIADRVKAEADQAARRDKLLAEGIESQKETAFILRMVSGQLKADAQARIDAATLLAKKLDDDAKLRSAQVEELSTKLDAVCGRINNQPREPGPKPREMT